MLESKPSRPAPACSQPAAPGFHVLLFVLKSNCNFQSFQDIDFFLKVTKEHMQLDTKQFLGVIGKTVCSTL